MAEASRKRIISIDILRMLAAFGVMYNHCDLFKYYLFTGNEAVRILSIALSYWCSVSVTLFFMLSGALLLGREEDYRRFTKRVCKVAAIIMAASIMQYIYRIGVLHQDYSVIDFLKDVYKEGVEGGYWFLYSYLSFVICLPFLRKMVAKMKEIDYLYLAILYVIFEVLIKLFEMYFASSINLQILILKDIFLFPILGYWIYTRVPRFSRKTACVVAISGILLTIIRQYIFNYLNGEFSEDLIVKFSALLAGAMFALALYIDDRQVSEKTAKLISLFGRATLGVYLIANIVKDMLLPWLNYMYQYQHRCLSLLAFIIVEFLICMAVSVTFILIKDRLKRYICSLRS